MKTMYLTALAAMLAAGCSNNPPPAWKGNAGSALAAFSDAYLRGESNIAGAEFARARAEMASTGRPDLVAHAELVRCATRVASMEYDACPAFEALAQDATPAERAYAAYLAGRWDGLDAALLPEQHRAVLAAARANDGRSVLAPIGDPLARLVAAGALMRQARIAPADIAVATDTASEQGWRRPLLMWLGVALKRAQAAGDTAQAARLQRRIDLAGATPGAAP
ncbi:hypothetical protein HF313_20865 [Massilia atriviolacea]|uniref:Uncharacterized protein n=1 Tax=Massilia atriviolacea TaxID=2495579 RepID=A0A430HRY8_9BURK|nr:hypothetical protein [Massilia atriviolacea]RSZ60262.1 hypothetical protein EJB06_03825 [Massilia atriviolacea]